MTRSHHPKLLVATAALAVLALLAGTAPVRAQGSGDPSGRVARLNIAVGTVSMQPAGSDTWVDDVLNRPLTVGDKLWVDRESRAELHVGSTALRLGSNTGVGILNVDDRTVQVRLTAGSLRLRVRALGTNQTFEVATPLAAVSLLQPGNYRIDVNDAGDELRIAVEEGQVAVTNRGRADVVNAGELAVYEDGNDGGPRISDVPRDDAFDRWAAQRDAREERAVSTRYVSREVTGYEDLDEYGTWREVPEYGPIWMPAVQAGWAPYQSGHWAWVAPWGWTWIDEAPWGFAPFHYGRWVHFAGDWCWAPGPRYAEPVYAPALVGWVGGSHWSVGISIGASVGWFPLGWNEVYVPSYPVSNTYVRNVNVTNIHVTNEYVNNYIVNNTTVNNGVYAQKTTDDRQLDRRNGGMQFRNQAIPGAVTATTQAAFASAQPVRGNRVAVPREARVAGATAAPPPVIAPTAKSIGRPAPGTDRGRAQVWDRDVVTRAPVPPAATPAANLRRGTPEAGQLPGMGQPNRGSRGDRPIGPAAEPQRGEPGRAGQAPVRVRDAAPDAQPRGRDDRAGDGGRASDRGIGVLGGRPPMDRTGRPAGREPVNGAGAPRSRDDRPQDRAAAPGVDRGQAERGVRTPNEQQNRPAAREERPRAFAPQPSRDDRPPAREAAPAVDRGPAVRDSRPPRDPPYRPSVREDRPQGRESAPALPAVREGRPASRDVIEPPRDTRPQYQPPTRSYAPIDAPIRAPERESRPPVERAPTAVEYRAPPREFVPPPMREVRPEPRPEARPPPPPPRQEPRPAPQADPHPDRANAGRRNDDPRRG